MKTWTRQEDKQALPPGEWQNEPDKAVWVDETTDLDCMINRNRVGNLCGYVGVPPTHPLHSIHYGQPFVPCLHLPSPPPEDEQGAELHKRIDNLYGRLGWEPCPQWECPSPESIFQVHGGLTYSGACQPSSSEAEGICHVPQLGRSHEIWWFGFDCGHAFDYAPIMEATLDKLIEGREKEVYKTYDRYYRPFSYVKDETTQLAQQLRDFTP